MVERVAVFKDCGVGWDGTMVELNADMMMGGCMHVCMDSTVD